MVNLKEEYPMKEKKRVLDLVEKGIISSEEALVLLENMASEKDEQQIKHVSDKINVTNQSQEKDAAVDLVKKLESQETEKISDEQLSEQESQTKKQQDYDRLEKILANLAAEASKTSVELDTVNEKISTSKLELNDLKEQVMTINTKEELGELSAEEKERLEKLERQIKELTAELVTHKQQKSELEEELKTIRKERFHTNKERVTSKIEIPDDWKEQATDTMNQFGDKLNETSSQIGSFFKKTVNSITEAMNDNLEWKDINLRVPGVASTKFEHVFNYIAPKATLIDIKIANGNIVLKNWDQPDVKVEGDLKIYGKIDTDSPLEAFLERSQIDVDDEIISFQIPNKRVRADLVFYLPKRIYDHIAIKLLNGMIMMDGIEVKDIYVKSTNGAITLNNTVATMLEIEGVNGDIKVIDGSIIDTVAETVNGNMIISTSSQTISASLVNGNVKITAKESNLKKVDATSVNGNVKVAMVDGLSVEGKAKTNLGSIHSRIENKEIIKEKKERTNQLLEFRRLTEGEIAQINVATTTGNIYLKDIK